VAEQESLSSNGTVGTHPFGSWIFIRQDDEARDGNPVPFRSPGLMAGTKSQCPHGPHGRTFGWTSLRRKTHVLARHFRYDTNYEQNRDAVGCCLRVRQPCRQRSKRCDRSKRSASRKRAGICAWHDQSHAADETLC
jgi:hypothetical protein